MGLPALLMASMQVNIIRAGKLKIFLETVFVSILNLCYSNVDRRERGGVRKRGEE